MANLSNTTDQLLETLGGFRLDSDPVSCEPYGEGHINVTYLAITEAGSWYILQKINNTIFKDVPQLMRNIELVTQHQRKKNDDPRRVLTIVPAKDGETFLQNEYGYWRVYVFVTDSLCLQSPESDEDFYQSALAFGRFQEELADFPVQELAETIPDFHNTPKRYQNFKEAVAKDSFGRVAEVQEEINFVLAREEEMGTLQNLRDRGQLPSRVTHNDTKLNNVLLDNNTREALCVIDLDTVMPGLSLYDYGDSIRFGAATALEDEQDLSLMTIDLDRFRVFTRGFLESCPGLTAKEVEMLPLGAKTMTLECGMRFLTDYLEGDVYFKVHRDKHNLDRCRTQFKMVQDMEEKWDDMKKIVEQEADDLV